MVLVKRKRHASRLSEAGAPETVSGQEERLLCFAMAFKMADKGAACVVSKEAVKLTGRWTRTHTQARLYGHGQGVAFYINWSVHLVYRRQL